MNPKVCYRLKHMPTIEHKLQLCLNRLVKWTEENRIIISKWVHFCDLCKMHIDPWLKLDDNEIPVVKQYKYLGIIFDKKFSFIPRIKYLRWKCNKATQNSSSCRLRSGQKTVSSKIKTRLWIFFFSSATKSYLKELKTIHHLGLRLALGVFSTSTVESLYTESNETSLSALKQQELTLKYYIKLLLCQSNPIHDILFNPKGKILLNRKEKAYKIFGLHMKEFINETQLNTMHTWNHLLKNTTPASNTTKSHIGTYQVTQDKCQSNILPQGMTNYSKYIP